MRCIGCNNKLYTVGRQGQKFPIGFVQVSWVVLNQAYYYACMFLFSRNVVTSVQMWWQHRWGYCLWEGDRISVSGLGAECAEMSSFGRHSVSAKSRRPAFGTLSVSAWRELCFRWSPKVRQSAYETTRPNAVTQCHEHKNQMPVPPFKAGKVRGSRVPWFERDFLTLIFSY